MEDFMVAAAQMVGGAVVQEVVSRTFSLVLGKRKEKASQGQYLERFRQAAKDVEFVLERTAKLPIAEVSLLRDRIELKRGFIEAACELIINRNKKRQAPQGQQEIVQAATTRSSSPQGLVTRPAVVSVSSLIDMSKDELCLSSDDVERFEQFADSARNILRKVESGCSLRRWMSFPSPLVRLLFEWKPVTYTTLQADQERWFSMRSRLQEERGVEAWVSYEYLDRKRPEKSFSLDLGLRVSESTDIARTAIKCLQSLASQFNFVADAAMGELTLLADLHDVSYSHSPPYVGMQEDYCNKWVQFWRPDPLCCNNAKGHGPCANNVVSSELSHVFPEEVAAFDFHCYVSAPEYRLRKRNVTKNGMPLLELNVYLMPHYVVHVGQLQASYAFEVIGGTGAGYIDVSMQQMGEMVRSRAVNCFLRQPKVTRYWIAWVTKHGAVGFWVEKPRAGALNKAGGRSKS